MQITIDIPDELAHQLEPERGRLAEIIRRGLADLALTESRPGSCALADEVLNFLARGPQPDEIVRFRPSSKSIDRIQQLLDKNRESTLTQDEEAEMDYIQTLNNLFSMIKAHARQHLGRRA